jgi:hypothetical protein
VCLCVYVCVCLCVWELSEIKCQVPRAYGSTVGSAVFAFVWEIDKFPPKYWRFLEKRALAVLDVTTVSTGTKSSSAKSRF